MTILSTCSIEEQDLEEFTQIPISANFLPKINIPYVHEKNLNFEIIRQGANGPVGISPKNSKNFILQPIINGRTFIMNDKESNISQN